MNHFTAKAYTSLQSGIGRALEFCKRVEAEHPDKVYSVGLFAAGAALTAAVEYAFPGTVENAVNFVGDAALDAASFVLRESGVMPLISPDISPTDPLMQMAGIPS